MNRLIVLYGPTGVGKTSLSIALSKHFRAPIISSDSRQVFREMTIGTAVPSKEELAAAPHFFIHDRSVHDGFSAGDFEEQAIQLLDKQFESTSDILLVGGSNLYINALLYGFDNLPSDDRIRENLNSKSLDQLLTSLRELDPVYYEQVDRCNIARVRRAVEVCMISGQPYSTLRKGEVKDRSFKVVKIGLERPREELYERINRRVDQMVADGLETEARGVYEFRELSALQTVGYREMFDYFDGDISLERAIELIKQNSRHYAKRQMTWLRREQDIKWFSPDDTDDIIAYIENKKMSL